MLEKFDVTVIGGGPGGYVCAYGPGADNFTGVMDNTDIFKKISRITSINHSTCN